MSTTINHMDFQYGQLTEEEQKRLFLGDIDGFFFQAFTSCYVTIRNLAREHKSECSSETLHRAIRHLEILGEVNRAIELLDFLSELDSTLKIMLSLSIYWEIRLWIAKDKNTPTELLTQMFLRETITGIKVAISENPNFDISLLS